jgi:hypothetical protein
MERKLHRVDPVVFRTREIWRGMIKRCSTPSHPSYQYYGARGIKVCERWRESFDAFLEDVGRIPSPYSIDRMDNARDYEPGNVRLSTKAEQNRNKSNVPLITFDGVTKARIEWARDLGITSQALAYRLAQGFPLSQALMRGPMDRRDRRCGWVRK